MGGRVRDDFVESFEGCLASFGGFENEASGCEYSRHFAKDFVDALKPLQGIFRSFCWCKAPQEEHSEARNMVAAFRERGQ